MYTTLICVDYNIRELLVNIYLAGMGAHFIEPYYGIFSVEFKSVFIGEILPRKFPIKVKLYYGKPLIKFAEHVSVSMFRLLNFGTG